MWEYQCKWHACLGLELLSDRFKCKKWWENKRYGDLTECQ